MSNKPNLFILLVLIIMLFNITKVQSNGYKLDLETNNYCIAPTNLTINFESPNLLINWTDPSPCEEVLYQLKFYKEDKQIFQTDVYDPNEFYDEFGICLESFCDTLTIVVKKECLDGIVCDPLSAKVILCPGCEEFQLFPLPNNDTKNRQMNSSGGIIALVDDCFGNTYNVCDLIGNLPNHPLATEDCDNGGIDNYTECTNGGDPYNPEDDCEVAIKSATDICELITGNLGHPLTFLDCDIGGIDNYTECMNGGNPSDPADDCEVAINSEIDICELITGALSHPLTFLDCDSGGIDNYTECMNGGNPSDPADDCEAILELVQELEEEQKKNQLLEKQLDHLSKKYDALSSKIEQLIGTNLDENQSDFKILPNPNSGIFQIKHYIPDAATSAEIVISQIDGKEILRKGIDCYGDCSTEIYLTNELESGFYVGSLYLDGELTNSEKFVYSK